MAKNRLFSLFSVSVFFSLFLIFSCASSSGESSFYGAFEPEPLESVRAMSRTADGFKPLDLDMYFSSAADLVEISYTVNRRSFFILLDGKTRELLFEAASQFFSGLKSGFAPQYRESEDGFLFSVFVPQTNTTVYVSFVLENEKLYFILGAETEIFFTAAQLELFLAAIDADLLQSITDRQIDTQGEF